MKVVIDPSYPDIATDKTPTFVGVLNAYLEEFDPQGNNIGISKYWNADTTHEYILDYNRRLLPLMDRLKPIASYTEEDFDQIIDQIQQRNSYAESTIRRYRHLIYVVMRAGYQHDHCQDILWGTRYVLEGTESEASKVKGLVRLKKSFTPQQDIMIYQHLMADPETPHGEDVGLLLMYFCAYRNNEACGLNFGHLIEMTEHPNCYMLLLYQTVNRQSRTLKGSGKTRNANRILPIADCLRDFLLKRMAYIQGKIDARALTNPDGTVPNIADLPIACKGDDLMKRCASHELTLCGRMLFKDIGINQMDIATLEAQLHKAKFLSKDIEEKDATTYLFRRNRGSILHILGLSLSQVQYYIGQDVEDDFESRNTYTNEHKLIEIKHILEAHPINHLTSDPQPTQEISSTQPIYQSTGSAVQKYRLDVAPGLVHINVSAKEMLDTVTVQINTQSGQPIRVNLVENPTPPHTERTVDIHAQLLGAYRKAYNKMKK